MDLAGFPNGSRSFGPRIPSLLGSSLATAGASMPLVDQYSTRIMNEAPEGNASPYIFGLLSQRAFTSDRPLIRLDYSDNPEVLRHRNPDGSLIVDTHVHFDLDGYGAKWACGIPDQNILKPQSCDFASLFWSFQETCNITDRLKVELSLGV